VTARVGSDQRPGRKAVDEDIEYPGTRNSHYRRRVSVRGRERRRKATGPTRSGSDRQGAHRFRMRPSARARVDRDAPRRPRHRAGRLDRGARDAGRQDPGLRGRRGRLDRTRRRRRRQKRARKQGARRTPVASDLPARRPPGGAAARPLPDRRAGARREPSGPRDTVHGRHRRGARCPRANAGRYDAPRDERLGTHAGGVRRHETHQVLRCLPFARAAGSRRLGRRGVRVRVARRRRAATTRTGRSASGQCLTRRCSLSSLRPTLTPTRPPG
jgi:hypothetical protein